MLNPQKMSISIGCEGSQFLNCIWLEIQQLYLILTNDDNFTFVMLRNHHTSFIMIINLNHPKSSVSFSITNIKLM